MIEEACGKKFGLKIDEERYNRYVLGEDEDKEYVEPDHSADAHKSLKGPWWGVQFLPQRVWLPLEKRKALRFPEQLRPIEVGATLHHSVLSRIKTGTYKPANLPSLDEDELRKRFNIEGSPESGGVA